MLGLGQGRLGVANELENNLACRLDVVDDRARLARPERGIVKVAVEVRGRHPGRVARPIYDVTGRGPPATDERSFTGTRARRRSAGGVPLLEGSVTERSVGCAGPPDVVEIGRVDGVRRVARDDALLVLGMDVRLVGCDEARPERHGLRTEGERTREPGTVADASAGE